jgi:hypothetical protein
VNLAATTDPGAALAARQSMADELMAGALKRTSVLGRRLPREQAVAELEKAAAPEQWQGQVEAAAQDRATLTFNQLQVALMAQISPAAQKRWVAVLDTHTRGSHRAADGQTVPAGGHFVVGGERLLYPRDPAGSPAETYNCRCVVVPG